ncbi:MAG: tRNA-specific 2-thiouridylase [Rikenellaceae bacterium]
MSGRANAEVVLAFSGGIDSCAAVDILRGWGYSVTALMLSLVEGDDDAVQGARARAQEMGVKFVLLDCRERFRSEIIDNFVEEYIAGRTPAPCTRCNPLIKWHMLVEYAKSVGAQHIATGHYFGVTNYGGKLYVSRGVDPRKDQSYYLWGLSQEALSMALTPMADRIKEDIKAQSTLKKESMGVCFLRGCHYSELIESAGHKIERGDIIDSRGEVVGEHRGLAYYTIGQKRGEGIPSGVAVTKINGTKNQIIVGENSELFASRLLVGECNIVDREEWLTSREIKVMVRGLGRNPEGYAHIEATEYEGQYLVYLSNPAWACAEGQPVVFYVGKRVIGGGYLLRAI